MLELNSDYCKTLYFSGILIWRFWSIEILLHFNLAFSHDVYFASYKVPSDFSHVSRTVYYCL